jgi:hypothetical protein
MSYTHPSNTSYLFRVIHSTYIEKAQTEMKRAFRDSPEEDRTDIAYRLFNEHPCQYQSLYANEDEMFLSFNEPDRRCVRPSLILHALADMVTYVKETLDCEEVDITKIDCLFALALALECAKIVT